MRSRLAALLQDPLVVAALVANLALQLIYQDRNEETTLTQLGDQALYRDLGANFTAFWQGHFQPLQLLRTPGYPLFLHFNGVFELSDRTILIEQALVTCLTGLAIAYIARLLGGVRAGQGAAIGFAVYLPLWSYSGLMLTEALSIASLSWAVVFCCEAVLRPQIQSRLLLISIFLGSLSVIIRPNSAVHLGVLILFGLGMARPSLMRLKALGVVAVSFLAVFAPWGARNLAVEGRPYLLGRNGPYTMNLGLNFPVDSDVGEFSSYRRSIRFWGPDSSDRYTAVEAAQTPTRIMVSRALKRPLQFAWSRVVLQYQLWLWPSSAREIYGVKELWTPYWLLVAMHWVVVAAGLAGSWILRRSRVSWLLSALVAVTGVPYLVYYPEPRYALPAIAMLIALASGGLAVVTSRDGLVRCISATPPGSETQRIQTGETSEAPG